MKIICTQREKRRLLEIFGKDGRCPIVECGNCQRKDCKECLEYEIDWVIAPEWGKAGGKIRGICE